MPLLALAPILSWTLSIVAASDEALQLPAGVPFWQRNERTFSTFTCSLTPDFVWDVQAAVLGQRKRR
eukprot:5588498-Prymnesium_polylepis.1